MCQLLGMNCNVPTDICFSFTGFQARGGLTDVHQDGWGIAFFEGKGTRLFLDPKPSAKSEISKFIQTYPIKSKNVIAHIRKATQGEIALENTHPFLRELWGFNWIFAHNGNLKNFQPDIKSNFTPVGKTDSEMAFCYMLESLKAEFKDEAPSTERLLLKLQILTKEISQFGEFNFLFSNGKFLIAHCSTRLVYIIRKAPFTQTQLKDQDLSIDFSQHTNTTDRVAIIATAPLTENENWQSLPEKALVLFEEGQLIKIESTI